MTPTQLILFLVWFGTGAVAGVALLRLGSKYELASDTQSAWMLAPGLFAGAAVWSGVDLGVLSLFAAFMAPAQTAFGAFGVLNLLHHARKGLTRRGGSST